jgi:hypothetical protein
MMLMLSAKIVCGQSASTGVGAGTMGLGNATSAMPDAFTLFHNPAGLGLLQRTSIAATSDRRPALPGTNRAASAVTLHGKWGTLSLGAFRFGDNIYSEQLLSIGYGHKLGLAALGGRADWIQYRAEGFDPFMTIGVTLGTMAQLTPQLTVGAYATNINRPRFPDGQSLPVRMAAGFAWRSGEKTTFVGDLIKELRYEPTIRGGMELTPVKKLTFRTGFNLFPGAIYGGLSLCAWKITFDYALSYNYELLSSHQMSIVFSNGRR